MKIEPPIKAFSFFFLIGTLLLTWCLYHPGKDGPFVLDDSSSIAKNYNIRVHPNTTATFKDAAYSMNEIVHSDSAIPKRALSYISFALNFYFAEDILPEFKLTNVFLHLICGVLVFLLARKILEISNLSLKKTYRDWIALITCLVWLTHPLFVSTVLYITQRMTILSALFSFLAVLAFIQYRLELLSKNISLWRPFLTITLCATCAYFSKETGALIPIYCLAIELIFFRLKFHTDTPPSKKILFLSCLILPCIFILIYLAQYYLQVLQHPSVNRHFTINERLMTEMRILWQYLSYLLLIDPKGISFFHDNIAVSNGLLSPLSTLVSLIAWLVIAVSTVTCIIKNKAQLFSFGILWFLIGHLLESTVINLELAFEHRNYAPGMGIILLSVTCLFYLFSLLFKNQKLSLVFVLLVSLTMPYYLNDLVSAWKSHQALTKEILSRAPDSPRALFQMANIKLWEKDQQGAMTLIQKAKQLQPWEAAYEYYEITQLCKDHKVIPKELVERARINLKEGIPSAFTFNQFNDVMKLCNLSEYDAQLDSIYKSTAESSYDRLAANGLLMLARVEERKKHNAEYMHLLTQAKNKALTFEVKKELETKGLITN